MLLTFSHNKFAELTDASADESPKPRHFSSVPQKLQLWKSPRGPSRSFLFLHSTGFLATLHSPAQHPSPVWRANVKSPVKSGAGFPPQPSSWAVRVKPRYLRGKMWDDRWEPSPNTRWGQGRGARNIPQGLVTSEKEREQRKQEIPGPRGTVIDVRKSKVALSKPSMTASTNTREQRRRYQAGGVWACIRGV